MVVYFLVSNFEAELYSFEPVYIEKRMDFEKISDFLEESAINAAKVAELSEDYIDVLITECVETLDKECLKYQNMGFKRCEY